MLSEERVIHMTRMAMDEEKNADRYTSVINITKKDYLSWHGLVSFLLGTITYVVFFGAMVAALLHKILDNITIPLVMLLALLGVIGYLLYLYLYMSSSRRWAKRQYEAGRKALHHRISDWDRLEEIYIEEEENKSPTMTIAPVEELPEEELKTGEEPKAAEEPPQPIVVLEPVVESAIERLQRQKAERE